MRNLKIILPLAALFVFALPSVACGNEGSEQGVKHGCKMQHKSHKAETKSKPADSASGKQADGAETKDNSNESSNQTHQH